MTDEIRIYHVDDPNDAPDRRLVGFPAVSGVNPFLPVSPLTQCMIPQVAGLFQAAMHQYWYSAYQQGVASVQQQVQQQRQQQQQQPRRTQDTAHHLQHNALNHSHLHQHHQAQQQQHSLHHLETRSHHLSHHNHYQSHVTPSVARSELAPQPNCGQAQHDSPQPPSSASTVQMASSSSCSASSSASSTSSVHLGSPQTPSVPRSHYSMSSRDGDQEQTRRPNRTASTQEHIKKPLNPFMIFMQKQRPEIVRQNIIRESAAINQLLGQQWRKLTREEQEPYYKLAEQEKILHAQKYPGWSARDNYANQKKRKKLKLKSISLDGLDQLDKKCRARYGLNNLSSWCKPCKRKKKCIYSMRRDTGQHLMRRLEPSSVVDQNKMIAYQ